MMLLLKLITKILVLDIVSIIILIVDYFDVIGFEKQGEELHLFFEEKNNTPAEYVNIKLSSKGFLDEITVQDFPIRGQRSLLHIKRRRWLNHKTGRVVTRNWDLIAKGTRMTTEFASFLKEIT